MDDLEVILTIIIFGQISMYTSSYSESVGDLESEHQLEYLLLNFFTLQLVSNDKPV